ncbi:hypothetical protein OPV22_030584 [Ensete ventricosum]|uniref:DUF4378 domain-containing protein n=1 Tax=Ensete ventricosum TaxID=4639 RepID=A0AAV8P680_ENSVE|nr:hypothetical protein OPV22_030584 [Ensete ventricosum]
MGRDWSWSTRPSPGRGDREEINPGCMSCMFPYSNSTGNSNSSSRAPPSPPSANRTSQRKGLEAPRNSLELGEEEASSAVKGELYDVPVGVEVRPFPAPLSKSNNKMTVFLEDEKRSSQAETPRTPSVIARLMGLEIPAEQCLSPMTPDTPPFMEPQAQSRMTNKRRHVIGDGCGRESPSPRNPLRSLNCSNVSAPPPARTVDVVGSRSLPETPRVSSTGSRDVEARLSLQLNKENTHEAVHGFGSSSADYPLPSAAYAARSRKKDHGRHHDENKSPRSLYHAREIVQQVKESFNNRRGGGGDSGSGGDEIKSKSKRTRPPEKKLAMADPPSSTCSRQIRPFLEVANNKTEDVIRKPLAQPPMALPSRSPDQLSSSRTVGGTRDRGEAKVVKVVLNKCRKADYERFTGRIKKQTRSLPTLASLFLSADSLPQRNLPDKNNSSSSPSTTTSRLNEASQAVPRPPLPIGSTSHPSNSERNHRPRKAPKDKDSELRYVKCILQRAGIGGAHTLRWYSPSLPVDPIVFHRLELEFPFLLVGEGKRCKGSEVENENRALVGPLRHRWNRKLLFHLVEEILGDLLLGRSDLFSSPCTGSGSSSSRLVRRENYGMIEGEALLQQLVAQIESFPDADCRVVGDIDALVAGDLRQANVRRLLLHPFVTEEAGDLALEVEQEILDDLLGETAASLALSAEV